MWSLEKKKRILKYFSARKESRYTRIVRCQDIKNITGVMFTIQYSFPVAGKTKRAPPWVVTIKVRYQPHGFLITLRHLEVSLISQLVLSFRHRRILINNAQWSTNIIHRFDNILPLDRFFKWCKFSRTYFFPQLQVIRHLNFEAELHPGFPWSTGLKNICTNFSFILFIYLLIFEIVCYELKCFYFWLCSLQWLK